MFDAYQERGATFALPALTEYQVLACSDDDIKAVAESIEENLSFHAAMTDASSFYRIVGISNCAQRLKHKYTMFGFEHNHVDPHNAVPARTLKVLLRMHLPKLRHAIQIRVAEGFGIYLQRCRMHQDGKLNVSFGVRD